MIFVNNWTINLCLIPKYDFILNTIFKEKIEDINILYKLLNLPDDLISGYAKKYIIKILEHIDIEKGELNVTYYQIIDGLGRFNPNKNLSLLYLPRKFKHTIFKCDNWIDIDIKKSYHSIIYEIGKQNNYNFCAIYKFINNFEEIENMFKEYYSEKLNNEDIKKLFLMGIFGGNFRTWLDNLKNNVYISNIPENNYCRGIDIRLPIIHYSLKKYDVHPFYIKYINEFKIFYDFVTNNNEDLKNIIIERLKQKTKKITEKIINNHILHYFFGIIESNILTIAYKFLIEKKIIEEGKCILEFDGICIPNFPNYIDINDLLNELNNLIYVETNFNIIFTHKPYNETFTVNTKFI